MELKTIKPETIFILLAVVYGLAFLVIMPPLQVHDENNHFYRAFGLTEGHLIPEKVGNEAGFLVPEDVWQLGQSFYSVNKKLTVNDLTSRIGIKNNNEYHFADLSHVSVVTYSPIPYVVPASAIFLGNLFDLSPLLLTYLARLANLIVWILLVYLAIRIIPMHKWVLLMLALMPMTLSETASVSADSLTIGLSFLLIAYILKLVFDSQKFTKRNFIILMVLGSLIALSKSIYILIFLLFLLIPVSNFKGYKLKYGILTLILVSLGLIVGIWTRLTTSLYTPFVPNWSLSGQFHFILSHPLNYLNILIGTFLSSGNKYLISFVGTLGDQFINLPFKLVLAYLLMIVFVAVIDKNRFDVTLRQKLICLIIFIFNIGAVTTFEYLTWTPIGAATINGIQGRYFIPFASLFFLFFYKPSHTKFLERLNLESGRYKLLVVGSILITLSLTLFILIKFYYSF